MREADNETDLRPVDETDLHLTDVTEHPRQRSARNNEEMRDGDSSHGSPEYDGPNYEYDSDRDIGDTAPVPEELESEEAGVLEAVPGDQDARPLEADPPAHTGLHPTDEADEEFDEGGPDAANGAGGLPLENYNGLTVRQIMDRLNGLPTDKIRRVKDYEQSHRRRKTLLVYLERRLQSGT